MKEISREEFEAKIQDLIDGKTSRRKLVKELETESRTLNNKIRTMSEYNPELYSAFVNKFPYRSRERDDIDYEALIIEVIKDRMTAEEVTEKYGVSVRTVQRKVNALNKTNPYLVDIYKKIKINNSKQVKPTIQLQEKIDGLVRRPVVLCEINGHKKQELEEIEKIYNERCLTMSKEEARCSMGLSREKIFKIKNLLCRIRTEEESKTFKERLKVDEAVSNKPNTIENKEKSKSDIEKGEEK